jgi:hypothetical protein
VYASDDANAVDWSSCVAIDGVLDVDVEVADHDVAMVEVVVVVVAVEPEAQKKIARFWRRRQRICGGGGF